MGSGFGTPSGDFERNVICDVVLERDVDKDLEDEREE